MQMTENLSYTEMEARLHYYENHTKYLASQLNKVNTELNEAKIENKELKSEINRLNELLKLAVKKTYAPSNERFDSNEQLTLFGEIEEEAVLPKRKVKEHFRSQKRSYEEIYKNIPTEIREYDITDEEKICGRCQSEMVCIGYDSYREIEYIPAVLKVIEHKRKKYACKKCDQNDISGNIKTAEAPLPLFDHSLASPSFLAHIIYEKFCKAVPSYRLEQELHGMGANISRQTMSNWLIAGGELLKPLYDLFHIHLVSEEILHADETPLQVNHVKDRDKPVNGYMWLYRAGKFSKRPIVLYKYQNGRKGSYPAEFLKKFFGYLHCDGLRQYDDVSGAVRVGCWAHVRRYFKNALDVQDNKGDYSTLAGQGFLMIEEIFEAEGSDPKNPKEERKYSLDEIAAIRKKKSQRLVEKFFDWCEKNQGRAVPKSLTGKAIAYALGQKKSLTAFLEDPRLELTNNAAERAIKPFVIGRKNWLFANTEKGAQAAAVIYSVVETAKENLLKPFDYLKYIFDCLRNVDFKSFEDFLPWNGKIPECIRL